MTTPIKDFIQKYISSSPLRLHMPGHKGKALLGFEEYDITEIDGADVLYHADGIILESMRNASEIFGTGKTLYSAEGSSLSVRAMLFLAVKYAKCHGKNPLIFAGRNAHKVFVMSASLLDFDIKWLYGDNSGGITQCIISPKMLEKELKNSKELPCAVYITSPDYLGNTADIEGISKVCRKFGVLLLVDNAHGAYLNFLPRNIHPIALGAHMCCDSAHKTLPALTGAGYLHIAKDAPCMLSENAEKAMSLFASTSPSYLILQSLDAVNEYLSDGYREKLSACCKKIFALKKNLSEAGISNSDLEPLKITLNPKKFGYTGNEVYEYLRKNGIVCEFYDADSTVMMLTPDSGKDVTEKIYSALSALPVRPEICTAPPPFAKPETGMSVKDAILSDTEILPLAECRGRIYAGICVSCPPAIPVAVCGEIIDDGIIHLMEYYGETRCEVVKKP